MAASFRIGARLLVALALLCGGGGGIAFADWSYSEVVREGGAPATLMAVTARQYHGFGLRCDGAVLSVQYLTNDPMSEEQMRRINAGAVSLTLRFGTETRRIAGEMQRVPQGAVFVALAESGLLEELEKARGEVLLSIDFAGRTTHRRAFDLAGASGPLGTLRRNCSA